MTSRREMLVGAAALGAAGAAGGLNIRIARAADGGAQVAGYYRAPVGDITVTALMDGHFPLPAAALIGYEAEEAKALLRAQFQPVKEDGGMITAINAYLVETGDTRILIDAGFAEAQPTTGKLADNLAAAGVNPESIDIVALTHLHPDHIGGLVDDFDEAVFPNAALAVNETDWNFWTSPENMRAAPEAMQGMFTGAVSRTEPYKDRLSLFNGEAEIAPGVRATPLYGHTPGHSGFHIGSGDAQMLVWGDIVHAMHLQFAHPDWAIRFDVDQEQAIKTRQRVFDMAATDRIQIAGMHHFFPGFGHVSKAQEGYRFHPAEWNYDL